MSYAPKLCRDASALARSLGLVSRAVNKTGIEPYVVIMLPKDGRSRKRHERLVRKWKCLCIDQDLYPETNIRTER